MQVSKVSANAENGINFPKKQSFKGKYKEEKVIIPKDLASFLEKYQITTVNKPAAVNFLNSAGACLQYKTYIADIGEVVDINKLDPDVNYLAQYDIPEQVTFEDVKNAVEEDNLNEISFRHLIEFSNDCLKNADENTNKNKNSNSSVFYPFSKEKDENNKPVVSYSKLLSINEGYRLLEDMVFAPENTMKDNEEFMNIEKEIEQNEKELAKKRKELAELNKKYNDAFYKSTNIATHYALIRNPHQRAKFQDLTMQQIHILQRIDIIYDIEMREINANLASLKQRKNEILLPEIKNVFESYID